MRFAFLVSGVAGFLLVAVTGLSAGRALDLVLRDAALACLAAALVGRWFWRGLDRAFAQVLAARRAEAEAAEAAPASPSPVPSDPAPRALARR